MRKISTLALLLVGLGTARADDEWAKGVSYTTDWDKAIKLAKETGKMLFIYNGWEREKV